MHRFENAPFLVWKGGNSGEMKRALYTVASIIVFGRFSVEEGRKRIKTSRTMRFQLKTH